MDGYGCVGHITTNTMEVYVITSDHRVYQMYMNETVRREIVRMDTEIIIIPDMGVSAS